jgi:tetratricopeptide (TPR) repeat protein
LLNVRLQPGGDEDAGPAQDLRVITLIDRGVPEAGKLGGDPEMQADLFETLGKMYLKLGKLDKAQPLLQSSLTMRESNPQTSVPAHVDSLISLGSLRREQGQSKEAEALTRKALEIIMNKDPNDKSLLAKADSALGDALLGEGKNEQAVDILNHAVSLESSQGPTSAELPSTLSSLADAYLSLV